MAKISVLLADDHTILRVGLRAYLRYHDDIEVVGEAQNGGDAVAQVKQLQPDVVIMDISMPGMNGIEATRLIRAQYPQTKVLILSQHEDPDYVIPLLQAGASGYILKSALGTDLLSAIRQVAHGETFLSPPIAKVLAEEIRHPGESTASAAQALTPRERQVLQMITQGRTNAQIADALSISINTVEWHRANVMNKLGVHTVVDLVRYALHHGLAKDKD
jgi:DNA-binding NarL/FixJ family response regulator